MGDAMTLGRFMIYIQFSKDCPAEVSAIRWRAMLGWLDARIRLCEPLEYSE